MEQVTQSLSRGILSSQQSTEQKGWLKYSAEVLGQEVLVPTVSAGRVCAQLVKEPDTGYACSQQWSPVLLQTAIMILARMQPHSRLFLCCASYSFPHQLEGRRAVASIQS